jgi:hypothetical protein
MKQANIPPGGACATSCHEMYTLLSDQVEYHPQYLIRRRISWKIRSWFFMFRADTPCFVVTGANILLYERLMLV